MSKHQSSLRSSVLRTLTEVRRAQVRIRSARSKLESLNDVDGVSKLESLDDILERIALRLETLLALGFASSEILRATLIASRALEPLKHYAPLDVVHVLSEVQDVVERVYRSRVPPGDLSRIETITVDEVEDVLREAMEKARAKARGSRETSSSKEKEY